MLSLDSNGLERLVEVFSFKIVRVSSLGMNTNAKLCQNYIKILISFMPKLCQNAETVLAFRVWPNEFRPATLAGFLSDNGW